MFESPWRASIHAWVAKRSLGPNERVVAFSGLANRNEMARDAGIEHVVEEVERRLGVGGRGGHFAPPDRDASIEVLMSDARRRMRPLPIRYWGSIGPYSAAQNMRLKIEDADRFSDGQKGFVVRRETR
jgi:hypothetical protein